MKSKPKTPQPETPNDSQERDQFQTPAYAIPLLTDFMGKDRFPHILEPASGDGNMAGALRSDGFKVTESDILPEQSGRKQANFLDMTFWDVSEEAIVTNPPFSLKEKFLAKCFELAAPFALLVPADYSAWMIDAIRYSGCKVIVPTRRIDFITPKICELVWREDALIWINGSGIKTLYKKFKDIPRELHVTLMANVPVRYRHWREIPEETIARVSHSQFHSVWLTGKLVTLPGTHFFADLSLKDKQRIFAK